MNAAELAPECEPDAKPKPGGKARLLTLDDLDKRTKAAQRAFELRDNLVSERGGAEHMSSLRYIFTCSTAVLSAMIEDLNTRWLRGEPVDPSSIATLLNARRREAEVIGIDPAPRDVTPTLAEYLAQRAQEKAEAT